MEETRTSVQLQHSLLFPIVITTTFTVVVVVVTLYHPKRRPPQPRSNVNSRIDRRGHHEIPRPPPSPPSLPIIGHLHLLSLPLHHSLTSLSHRLGPVFLLRLGSRPALVVSSPSSIQDCYVTNDVAFSDRPRVDSFKDISYGFTSFGTAPYGPRWQSHRKIANSLLFSPHRLHFLSSSIINDAARVMVKGLFKESGGGGEFKEVKLLDKVYEFTINIIMGALAGKRCFGDGHREGDEVVKEQGRKFRWILEEYFDLLKSGNPEDYLPFLKWFGFAIGGGNGNRRERLAVVMDEFIGELLEESRKKRALLTIGRKGDRVQQVGEEEEDMHRPPVIESLLVMQEAEGAENFSDLLIKGMIQTILLGSAHSAALAMEWTTSVLLNHPEILAKVTSEIDGSVGSDRLLDDSDLPNLPYLRDVFRESLRLYPIGPILLPRESSRECTVGGFRVPKGTILLTNAYALHRDPELWEEPARFRPERFEKMGAKDLAKMYFPFGAGRRSCPGEQMAMRKISLGLGALLQCFRWERTGDGAVDLSEGPGLSMPMVTRLVARYKPRADMLHVLSQL